MKLNLKRLFARSMTGEPDLIQSLTPPSPRSAKRKMMLVTLAGILAIVGALAGGYYFAMRPVTLRIAVGPASSDDIKVVQALTQAFSQTHSQVRLRPMQTEGAAESAKALLHLRHGYREALDSGLTTSCGGYPRGLVRC